jgi:hypothetical protein
MTSAIVNAAGQFVTLLGALVLFRYGMPYRVRAGGGEPITTNPKEDIQRLEACYDRLGWLGIVFIMGGTAAQIVANFWPAN